MKIFFSFFILILFGNFSLAQKELVNVYNSYSEVYGGMEDGGISRTESFTFIAKATIEIKDIFYNGEKIFLKKGDSLIVNVSKYIPYNPLPIVDTVDGTRRVVYKPDFKVMKIGRKFYVNVQFPYIWPGVIEYIYKKETYASKIKDGFDDGNTGYAP